MAENDIVARKHLIVYLRILLGYGIWFLVLLTAFVYVGTVRPGPEYTTAIGIIMIVILAVLAISFFFFVWSWMDTKRFTWTAGEEGVTRRCGWMPWQRSTFTYPYDTIFEAYYTDNIVGHYIGSHTITIRRTEGVTSNIVAASMQNAKEIVQKVNQRVKEAKALQHVSPVPMMVSEAPRAETGKSQAEQLRDLASLKADGTITDEEFNLMKRKIIMG